MSLKLFCLVYPDDDSSQQPFSVKAGDDDTIDDLKKVIKAEALPHFPDMAASRLILWKLEPSLPEDGNLQTALKDVKLDGSSGAKQLASTAMVMDMFPDAPKQHIHVLIQLPLSGEWAHFSSLSRSYAFCR